MKIYIYILYIYIFILDSIITDLFEWISIVFCIVQYERNFRDCFTNVENVIYFQKQNISRVWLIGKVIREMPFIYMYTMI